MFPPAARLAVTVPGALDAWDRALRRFGRLSLAPPLEPAANAALTGTVVTQRLARWIATSADDLRGDRSLAAAFLADGKPLEAGMLLRQPQLAASLRHLMDSGLRDFYVGDLAAEIATGSEHAGGLLRADDLEAHTTEWVMPLKLRFDGVDVYTTPPNSQGLASLQILNLLSFLEGGRSEPGMACQLDAFVRARQRAFRDRDRYLSDPDHVTIPIERLLSPGTTPIAPQANHRLCQSQLHQLQEILYMFVR